ncbi:MAG TPA: hypothetical protein VHZ55_13460 [Bryobacteraceae bacterium]|nr:hypothetical protein [Bryobacteraceae bacterium]
MILHASALPDRPLRASRVPCSASCPKTIRPRFLEHIRREINIQRNGGVGRIMAKFNQMEDPEMIGALVDASNAGVSTGTHEVFIANDDQLNLSRISPRSLPDPSH